MNKKILLLLPALTLVLAGCNNQNKGKSTPSSDSGEVVGVESVTVTPDTLNLEAGQTATLAATVKPVSVENKDVVWSTNNPAAATVDASGKVTAVGEGIAVITATSDADESKKGTCTVTVTEPLFKPIKNPVLEKTFKFGTYQENLKKRIFFNGEEEAYPRLQTTDVYDEAVDVYFEAVDGKEGKYYFVFGEGTDKKYIGLSQNQGTTDKPSYRIGTVGAHSYDGKNFEITMEDAEWDWDATNYTVKQTRGDEDFFPGTYSTWDTISGCAMGQIDNDFVFQFLTVSKPTVLGNDYVIPGTSTQLSVALPADVTDTPVWSLEGDPVGVTVSQSGLVEATTEAVDGTQFNVKVVVGEYTISYPMTVTALNLGTLEDPIDVAEAKHNIDLVGTTGVMYIKGTVAKNTVYDSTEANQYWQQVWLDGDTKETGFEGFKLKLDAANEEWKYVFAEANSMVGVEVVISGRGTTYNGIYETDGTETSKLAKATYEHSSTIVVKQGDVKMAPGQEGQFTATFEQGKHDAAVWSVAPVGEAVADKVTIADEHSGIVSVAADATANAQYTLTAALLSDPNVKATATITIGSTSYTAAGAMSLNKNANVTIDNQLEDTEDPRFILSENGVTATVRKNTSSSGVNVWQSSYSSARWYVGHACTIEGTEAFSKIEITCDGAGYSRFKNDATGIIPGVSGGASVSYDGTKIILTLLEPTSSITIVPDKQIRPSNIALFKVSA